eukprot:2700615-Rhodomonas_salina.1
MGEKDWKALDLAFDASDRDTEINMEVDSLTCLIWRHTNGRVTTLRIDDDETDLRKQVWPVVGRYMPDTIATFA